MAPGRVGNEDGEANARSRSASGKRSRPRGRQDGASAVTGSPDRPRKGTRGLEGASLVPGCGHCLRGTATLLFGHGSDVELQHRGQQETSRSGGSSPGSGGTRSGKNGRDHRKRWLKETPGRYRVTSAAAVCKTAALGKHFAVLEVGTVVDVVELVHGVKEQRLRARILEPAGWISLAETSDTPFEWAERVEDEGDATSAASGRRATLAIAAPPGDVAALELQVRRVDFAKGAGPWTCEDPKRSTFAPRVVIRVDKGDGDGGLEDVRADSTGAFLLLGPEHPLCRAGAKGVLFVADGSDSVGRCKVVVGRPDASATALPAAGDPAEDTDVHTVLLVEKGEKPRRTIGEVELAVRWRRRGSSNGDSSAAGAGQPGAAAEPEPLVKESEGQSPPAHGETLLKPVAESLQTSRGRIDALERDLSALTREREQQASEIAALSQERDGLAGDLAASQDALRRVEAELSAVHEQAESGTGRLSALEAQLEAAHRAREDSQAAHDMTRSELAGVRGELDAHADSIQTHKSRAEGLERDLHAARREKDAHLAWLDSSKAQVSALERDLAAMTREKEEKVDGLESDMLTLLKEKDAHGETLEAHQAQVRGLHSELAAERGEAEARLREAQEQLAAAQRAKDETDSHHAQTRSMLADISEQFKSASSERDAHLETVTAAKSREQASEMRIASLCSELAQKAHERDKLAADLSAARDALRRANAELESRRVTDSSEAGPLRDPAPSFQEFDRKRGHLLLSPPTAAPGAALELQVLRLARNGSTWTGVGQAACEAEAPLASLLEKPDEGGYEPIPAAADGRFRLLRPEESPLLSGGGPALLEVASCGGDGSHGVCSCAVLVDRSLPGSDRAEAHTALLVATKDASRLSEAPAVGEITVRARWVPDNGGA